MFMLIVALLEEWRREEGKRIYPLKIDGRDELNLAPKRVAWNLCNIFQRWSKGNDEELQVVLWFHSLWISSYIFPKRQVSQTPYLYTSLHNLNIQNILLRMQNAQKNVNWMTPKSDRKKCGRTPIQPTTTSLLKPPLLLLAISDPHKNRSTPNLIHQ